MSSTFEFLRDGEVIGTVTVDKDTIIDGSILAGYEVYGDVSAEDYLHYRVATMGNQLSIEQTKTGILWSDNE